MRPHERTNYNLIKKILITILEEDIRNGFNHLRSYHYLY